jgi:PAS domain S-box-containing protein
MRVRWVGPLHRGETTKVRDILEEPRTPAGEELVKGFAQRGLRSALLVPAMRLGKPRACLVVGDTRPRDWTEFESALARETLDRCWHAVERARAEESLRESEERFRGVYENAGTGIAIMDLNGKFQSCNPAYSRMLGYTEAELRNLICASLVHPEDGGVNLTQQRRLVTGEIPSFELLSRYITKRGELIWGYRHVTLLRDASGNPRNVIALVTDMTDRKRQEEQIELLMREVNHRSKNMLTVVHAIARRTAATSPEDFIGRFGERIIALAASQDLLIKNDWKGVDIHDLVQSQVAHFKDLICTRIKARGPRFLIAAGAAQNIGMALHELATNAGKYGALSGSEGQVAIDWGLDRPEDGGRRFFMRWKETEGPPVEEPLRTGFGSRVITIVMKDSLEADVELDYAPMGLAWRMNCPARAVIQADRGVSPDLHSE